LKEENLSLRSKLDEAETCVKALQEEHLGEAFTLQIMKKTLEDFGMIFFDFITFPAKVYSHSKRIFKIFS
jgi:hypothetical protein